MVPVYSSLSSTDLMWYQSHLSKIIFSIKIFSGERHSHIVLEPALNSMPSTEPLYLLCFIKVFSLDELFVLAFLHYNVFDFNFNEFNFMGYARSPTSQS